MLNEQTQPMTAEEGKNSVNIYRFAEAYHAYRLAFEKQQQQPADPYWSDPATWPEWANWRAVDMDGKVYCYKDMPKIDDARGLWIPSSTFDHSHIGTVTHNPDWRNSLRGREEVSDGK